MYISNLWQFLLLSVGSVAIAILFGEKSNAAEITLYMSYLYLIVIPFLFFIIVSNFNRIKADVSLLSQRIVNIWGPARRRGISISRFLQFGSPFGVIFLQFERCRFYHYCSIVDYYVY